MRFQPVLLAAALFAASYSMAQSTPPKTTPAPKDGNMLVYAAAWKQTAAEYRALYHQGYNIARMRLDEALKTHKKGDKPLAVITDIDDTILNAANYWGWLVNNNKDFFEDPAWDKWVAENKFTAMPGALEFFKYADSKGVQIFYVSNRDQGPKTFDYAIGNLKALGFPQVDKDHVTIQIDTSNKEGPQNKIAEKYNVVVMLGDNLNDFKRKYYVKDVDERAKLMEEDKDQFGRKFIVFPNPSDGHWIRAIFGDSEPPATAENRATFKRAASKSAWGGK